MQMMQLCDEYPLTPCDRLIVCPSSQVDPVGLGEEPHCLHPYPSSVYTCPTPMSTRLTPLSPVRLRNAECFARAGKYWRIPGQQPPSWTMDAPGANVCCPPISDLITWIRKIRNKSLWAGTSSPSNQPQTSLPDLYSKHPFNYEPVLVLLFK